MVRVPAKVRKEHEAKMAAFDAAIARAKAARDIVIVLFQAPGLDLLPEDAKGTITDAMNAANDLVDDLEGDKALEEREFGFYGVDPYQRQLVADNID